MRTCRIFKLQVLSFIVSYLTTELLHGSVVLADVLASLLLVELDEVLHDSLVEVLSSEMSVSIRSQHLEDSVVNGEHRHVERSSSEIEHEDVALS